MLKRVVGLLMIFPISFSSFVIYSRGQDINISAHSAIVMIAETGQVVYEKNAYEKRGMASTTKIMTSIVAIEEGNINDTVIAKENDVNVEGTSLGLKPGDSVVLLSLIKGMLLSSGNDSANVTASFIGGSCENFVQLMNEKAFSLNMKSTQFKNPSGLTEDGHFSTAFDMALLGSYAIENKLFREICSSSKATVSFGNPATDKTIYNHNKFLNMFDGAIGIKTGYTKAAGRCLVTAVEQNGVTLVCVTLNAPDDWNDHRKLYEHCFSSVKTHKLNVDFPKISVACEENRMVETSADTEIIIPYYGSLPEYIVKIYSYPFVYPGTNTYDCVGWVEISYNGYKKKKYYIHLKEDVEEIASTKTEFSTMDKIKEFLRKGLS